MIDRRTFANLVAGTCVLQTLPLRAQQTSKERVHIVELTLRSQVPAVFGSPEYVDAGGLMSYLSSSAWHWHTAASFVDKIVRGAKPANIPVEKPTKFELLINLKTAKALGITIAHSLLQRADKVIQ